MMMVSDASELETTYAAASAGSLPAASTPRPTTPMMMAAAMEIATHTEATRREVFSSFSSRMAMNRSRMWGIPK